MEQEYEEKEKQDISEEGEFEENEGYGNPLDEGDSGLYGNGKLL
jgi:hypothetical protein